jgi:hypothetical protein
MYHAKGETLFPRRLLTILCCSLYAVGVAAAQPDAAEQAQILKQMRQYAAAYKLPDVAFDQILTHFRAPLGSENWKQEWVRETKWIAHGGHFYGCCWGRKKGKWVIALPRTGARQYWKESWYIPGNGVFPWDGAKAAITWNRWDTARNHRLAVFDYCVSKEDSHYLATGFPKMARVPHSPEGIPFSGPVTDIPYSVNVPYSGEIWVDPESGGVWRLTDVATEFPARLKGRRASSATEYDSVTLGAATYLLPVAHTVVLDTVTERLRPEYAYRNYRKFEADSSITFFTADSTIKYRP